MKLADRPAHHLRRLMREWADELGLHLPVSGRRVAELAWPKLELSTTKGRVEHVLRGGWPRPDNMKAMASVFGVDAGVFYQEPADV